MLGSGTGRGSFIDSDIVFDEYGLPLFPGRRFKGLLRESAEEVIEMLTKCGSNSFLQEEILRLYLVQVHLWQAYVLMIFT